MSQSDSSIELENIDDDEDQIMLSGTTSDEDDSKLTEAIMEFNSAFEEGDVAVMTQMLQNAQVWTHVINALSHYLVLAFYENQLGVIEYFLNHPDEDIRDRTREMIISIALRRRADIDIIEALIHNPTTSLGMAEINENNDLILEEVLRRAILREDIVMMRRLIPLRLRIDLDTANRGIVLLESMGETNLVAQLIEAHIPPGMLFTTDFWRVWSGAHRRM